MNRGDINLTFKRYLESPVELTFEKDDAVDNQGRWRRCPAHAQLFRGVWGDKNAYASSHVGWGMNPGARWDAMTMYDRSQMNGTEQRAFAGNFLFSTGAHEHADRYTLGHCDLPMRNCTIDLDNQTIVRKGVLQGELA